MNIETLKLILSENGTKELDINDEIIIKTTKEFNEAYNRI